MIRKKLLLLLFTLCVLGIIQPLAFAADYYVDNTCTYNGNGQAQSCAAGTGQAGPFNSRANAQSGWTGNQSGNRLLFKKGQTFTGQFTVGAYGTGTGANVATISSYSSGDNPIISGGSSNISLSGRSYITIDAIDCDTASAQYGGNISVENGSLYVTVQNCTLTNSGSGVFFSDNSNYGTIANNIIYNQVYVGIWIIGSSNASRAVGYEIYGNEAYECCAGSYLTHVDNSKIYQNKFHNNHYQLGTEGEEYGIGVLSCSNNEFYENEIYDNNNKGIDNYGDSSGQWGPATGNKYYRNYVHGHTESQGCGLHTSSPDGSGIGGNEYYYNILVGNNNGITSDADEESTGLIYYGNVFYGNNVGLNLYDVRGGGRGATVKNNIFMDNTSYGLYVGGTTTGTVHENNLYWKTGGSGNVAYWSGAITLANVCNWETTGCQDTNPLFNGTSTWSDFSLQSGSPARDAGANLGGDYEDALDPNDTTWPPSTLLQGDYGPGWEIGAFIYNPGAGAAPNPPTRLTVVSP